MRKALLALAIFFVAGGAAEAQLLRRPFIRASGDAIVSVKPDLLKINVGVTTQAATAQEAADGNANQVASVLAALRRVLGSSGDIKTVSYSVNPNYKYPTGGGTPTLTGYTANNTVEVSTSDLSLAGKIIDTAVQAGATNVTGLRFTLKDARPVRQQALKEATQEARSRAEAIAAGLGVRLGHVLSAEEGGAVRPVTVVDARITAGATPTPIESGMVDVSATVVIEVEIAP